MISCTDSWERTITLEQLIWAGSGSDGSPSCEEASFTWVMLTPLVVYDWLKSNGYMLREALWNNMSGLPDKIWRMKKGKNRRDGSMPVKGKTRLDRGQNNGKKKQRKYVEPLLNIQWNNHQLDIVTFQGLPAKRHLWMSPHLHQDQTGEELSSHLQVSYLSFCWTLLEILSHHSVLFLTAKIKMITF